MESNGVTLPTTENGLPPLVEARAQTNESVGQPESVAQAGIFEKIRGHAHKALEKTVEVVSRGRGRPRKDGSPKANDIVRESEAESPLNVPVAFPADDTVTLSPSLVSRCLSGILKGALAVPNARLASKAVEKGKSENDAAKLVAQCCPTEEEISGLSEFAGILLKKYNVDTQYAPEVAACAIAAGIGLRYVAAFQTLNRFSDVKKTDE
jgi:hypothetical protein